MATNMNAIKGQKEHRGNGIQLRDSFSFSQNIKSQMMNSTLSRIASRFASTSTSSMTSFYDLKLLGSARAMLASRRSASSWQYNQRNTTTFGGATWQSHYASLHGGALAHRQHQHMLVEPPPMAMDGGMLKVLLAIFASIYVGGKIAQKAAAFLEENEIFVHTDDDDDD